MQNEQLNERYEELRQYLLAWGSFHPDTKANCMKILEKMKPELRKHLPAPLGSVIMLIEDQRLYIEKLEKELNNNILYER